MMNKITTEQMESLNNKVNAICYAFYRYEINNGMAHLESFISELTGILDQFQVQEEQLTEINQLLGLVQQAVENSDFLIAADVMKYELLGRLIPAASSSD